MGKKYEEGQIFSIELDTNKWTIGQLCNVFIFENSTMKKYTFAYFNYLFNSENELIKNIDALKLDKPIIITSVNGPLTAYGYKLIGKREINYKNIPNYKDDISEGYYKQESIDPDILLNAFFGIVPWDCYYKDGYVDNFLVK
jgi:hypothetical protein